ncbi:MAG: hypothetical protein JWR74_824 [Polaromonas sp.]|nr:hypothetical protein [Polaromonas sp.]
MALFTAAMHGVAVADPVVRAEWISGDCPKGLPLITQETPQKFAGLLAGVVAVIVPKLVSGGVDLAAKSLQAAGADRPNALSARTSQDFYNYLRERKITLRSKCLIVVEADSFDATPVAAEPHTWRPLASHVGSYQNPRMIFMAAVDTAPEGKLFRLVPAYFEIMDWRERSFWNNDRRDYTFAVTLSVIGQTTNFASVSMTLKGVEKREKAYGLADALMNEAATDFVPLPPLSAEGTKYVNNVELAWATKDRAASVLDEKVKYDVEALERASGKLPPPIPDLYVNPYLTELDKYCDAVRAANFDIAESKWEVPAICTWKVDQQLEVVTKSKKAVERNAVWLGWAEEVCWPDPAVRTKNLATPKADGYECTPPTTIKNESKAHTRVAGLITVTEFRPGSKTAKLLGDALAASAADVSKVIASKVPPLSQEARDTANTSDRARDQAVLSADFEVQIAEAELAELDSAALASKVTAARMKRQAAWYAANNAYRAAGRNPPYPEAPS